VRATYL
jgi:hypothetical protein